MALGPPKEELAGQKDDVRKLFRRLIREQGFSVKGNLGHRWLPEMQQTCGVYLVGFLPWFTIEYSVRLYRHESDARETFKETDATFDIRYLCGMAEGTLWSCGFNLEIQREWSERQTCIEEMVNVHLMRHMEELSDRNVIMDIIRFESVRRRHAALIPIQGYELIGGYENHIQDVEES